jgi:hypothetical protein
MISPKDARCAAERDLAQSDTPYRYGFLNVELDADEYSCVFAVYHPDGYEIDGPIIVTVDAHTGVVKPFVR